MPYEEEEENRQALAVMLQASLAGYIGRKVGDPESMEEIKRRLISFIMIADEPVEHEEED